MQANVTNHSWAHQAIAFSMEKTSQNMLLLDGFPELTLGDQWICSDQGGWTCGHWVGLLWLAYAYTRDHSFEMQARKWAARLRPRQYDTTTHDLGFLFENSHVLGANITGDAELKPPALQAARSLALRFNPKMNLFQAWGPLNASPELRGRTIIDTMMNLDLLFWASRELSEFYLAERAIAHARACLAHHVRDDFTTSHGAEFDPDTGSFLGLKTYQGLSSSSCWSRGQSWAIYGFVDCYRFTQDETFLLTSRHLVEYAVNHLPGDYVPFWDYSSPLIPHDVRDSSAASILACGLLYLAELENDPVMAERWQKSAEQILLSLWENYTSRQSIEPSILIHGTRSKPENFMDHGLIYGDYYFVEGLLRLVDVDLANALF
jgi:unsaturated chondroitin disaccharide hydrolase